MVVFADGKHMVKNIEKSDGSVVSCVELFVLQLSLTFC